MVRLGHVFSLKAKDTRVLFRLEHTEGSVDLCRLAGLKLFSVLYEVLSESSMTYIFSMYNSLPNILDFACQYP
ncbi:3,4-dihydroxy-2-butanone-4-phosphate synthase [Coxiella endosymbiont of Rhipicephalus microplus]